MKPTIIFSAVFMISALMALVLPNLTAPPPAQAAFDPTALPTEQVNFEAPAANPFAESFAQGAVTTQAQPEPTLMPTAVAEGLLDSASAAIPPTSLSDLDTFAASVVNQVPGELVGVYIPDRFALPVQQQPPVDHNYISPFDGVLTQYGAPLEDGAIAILAHNYLSGRAFFELQPGQKIVLVYGDGNMLEYTVTGIDRYQALSPTDPFSDFIDLNDPNAALQSFQQVYDRYYTTHGLLVFQTCIENNGDWSWGRLFVVAKPG